MRLRGRGVESLGRQGARRTPRSLSAPGRTVKKPKRKSREELMRDRPTSEELEACLYDEATGDLVIDRGHDGVQAAGTNRLGVRLLVEQTFYPCVHVGGLVPCERINRLLFLGVQERGFFFKESLYSCVIGFGYVTFRL